jgi:hypothetical protein
VPYDLSVTNAYGFTTEYRALSRRRVELRTSVFRECVRVPMTLYGAVTRADGYPVPIAASARIGGDQTSSAPVVEGAFTLSAWPCDEPVPVWVLAHDAGRAYATGDWLFASTLVHPSVDGQPEAERPGHLLVNRTFELASIGRDSLRVRAGDAPDGFHQPGWASLTMTLGSAMTSSGHVLRLEDAESSVPLLEGRPFSVTIESDGPVDEHGERLVSWSSRTGLRAGDSVEIPLVRPPERTAPRMIEDATPDTELTWSAAGTPSVYVVTVMPRWYGEGAIHQIATTRTALRVADFPNVAGPGWQWFVESVGTRHSVDELLDPDERVALQGRSTMGYFNAPLP